MLATAPRAAIQLGFDDGADGGTVGLGFLFVDVGDEADHLFELVEVDVLLRGDFDELGVAALVGRLQAAGGELLDDLRGVGFGLVDLLTATMMGTLAARAWSMASRVWGMTPSSAATTMTTMSVTLAPRARMRVKASWPGVSRKTISRPKAGRVGLGDFDLVGADVLGDAAGFAAGYVGGADGVESEVLPWSTWPMTGDDWRTDDLDHAGGVFEEAFDGFVLELLFDGDDGGVGSETGRATS